MKEVPLTQGKVAVVDDEDVMLVNKHNWHLNKCGENTFYARTHYKLVDGKSKKINMHQLILNTYDKTIEHLNGNGLDNRKENLWVVNTYKVSDDTTEITMSGGQKTIINSGDLERIKGYTWVVDKDTNGTPYVRGRKGKDKVRLHRLIMDAPKGVEVDHINHDTLDNRKENLRVCTKSQNLGNQNKTEFKEGVKCSSKYKGVSWNKANSKWFAYIGGGKIKRVNLGYFVKEEEAAGAYNKAALEKYGEFALLNEIENLI